MPEGAGTISILGKAFTVRVTVFAVLAQLPVVPVTLYTAVVVELGVTVGVALFTPDTFVVGDQV